MNFGPHIDPPEVLVHYTLTQVNTPRGSFRSYSNHVEAYWCAVKRRFKTMVGTTKKVGGQNQLVTSVMTSRDPMTSQQ